MRRGSISGGRTRTSTTLPRKPMNRCDVILVARRRPHPQSFHPKKAAWLAHLVIVVRSPLSTWSNARRGTFPGGQVERLAPKAIMKFIGWHAVRSLAVGFQLAIAVVFASAAFLIRMNFSHRSRRTTSSSKSIC